jgi:hypothetical protein
VTFNLAAELYSTAICLLTPTQAISDLVSILDSLGFRQGIRLLESALRLLDPANIGAACNQLSAFIHQVEAQSGKKLTEERATALIASATQIRAALECP